ncbi:MAG: GIY-YIG nuclease family protein, partial [Thermoguttaceae bacterium]|nr:GIY-YIG nuclease family protein [Thermoguttaceae bacterium]
MAEWLENALAKIEDCQRATSQAEPTKAGHVYILSNEGSFGPGVYKIGMTRRLDPRVRVAELSSASVPF